MERIVNIVGMGASAKFAPVDNGEIWGVNNVYKFKDIKIDKLFFMDGLADILALDSKICPEYTFDKFLKDNPKVELISKYMDSVVDATKNLTDENRILANINEFPLSEAVDIIGGGYFTSTLAYMMAYAILQKVDRIRLYGFELWSGSDANEYDYQRPCMDFWIAVAIGKGIIVEVPYLLMQNITNNQNYYGYVKGELYQNRRS
ncbi:hypothetical protein EHM76_03390 [bacterium]|nr:MAG: hypothetical protein EHM76_03390 [bacterium]